MLSFGMFITHGLACHVAIEISWHDYVLKRVSNSSKQLLWNYVNRTVIVLSTCEYTENLQYPNAGDKFTE